MNSNKLTIQDIDLFWREYSTDGKLTDDGFVVLIERFFYNEKEGWHNRFSEQPKKIQDKIFSMILRHQEGERFVKDFQKSPRGRNDFERRFEDMEQTVFNRHSRDKQ